jgi:hypothetical protein
MRTSILDSRTRVRRKLAAIGVLGLAITGVASVVLGTSVAATTLVVDDDGVQCPAATHTTISSAVAAASAGDTIQVCAGSYGENVLVDKTLTINGPNAGASALGARAPEAEVSSSGTIIHIQAPDVTFDGFKVDGDFGVFGDTSYDGVEVLNNIVTGSQRAVSFDTAGNGIAVIGNHLISPVRQMHLTGVPYTFVQVNRNRFSGPGTIFYSGNGSIAGFEFKDNEVLNSSNNMAARIEPGAVSGNTFTPSVPGSLALQIDLHQSSVSSNTWNGGDTSRCLQLYGVQFGLDPSEDVVVSNNTFTDCGGPSPGNMWALQLSEGIDGIDIVVNDFVSTNGDAINTRGTGWTLNPDIHVLNNNITGSTGFGVNNTVSGTLDAECNWWGATNGPGPVGPGSGDKVSTGVDYAPWLTAPAPGGPCNGVPPNPPPSKDACKNGGWMTFTDAQARPFKNQGDCVSYVATGGKNKAAG